MKLDRFSFPLPYWLRVLLYALAYYLLAWLGLSLSFTSVPFATLWPPSGLFVSVLLLEKRSRWPAYVIASIAANLAFDLPQGIPLWVDLVICLANSLEALVGAWLVLRVVGSTPRLRSLREVVALIMLSGLFSTALGASVGSLAVARVYTNLPLWVMWQLWWVADMLGVLIFAPFVLCAFSWPVMPHRRKNRWMAAEALFLMAVLVILTGSSFWAPVERYISVPEFLIIPVFLWIAVRFGPPGSAFAVLIMSLLSIAGTVLQIRGGIFGTEAYTLQALVPVHSRQIFIGINTFAALLMAATTAEKEQVEQELLEREESFRTLADNSPDLVYRYRLLPTPGFEYVSPSATQMVGYTPEEHMADPMLGFKLVHPDDREKLGALTNSPDKLREPIMLRWQRKDGSLLWVEQRNVPIYDDKGQLVALHGRARDITEKAQQEEALRESEARYRSFIEQSAEGFMLTDEEGIIIEANEPILRFSGLTREEMIGKSMWEIQYARSTDDQRQKNSFEALRQEFERMLRTGQSPTLNRLIEAPFLGSDGKEHWLQQILFVMPTARGYRLGGIARDITERKVLDHALLRSNEDLRRSMVELKSYQQQLVGINQMNARIQVCTTIEEALDIIAATLPELFPEQRGKLLMLNNENRCLEPVVAWGAHLPQADSEPVRGGFAMEDCWAIRMGQIHQVRLNESTPVCTHIHPPYPAASMCVPLMLNGTALGLLHLEQDVIAVDSAGESVDGFKIGLRELVEMMAESITMTIANIKLRETLSEDAIRDPLTGLYNRRYMEKAFEYQVLYVHQHQEPVCVLMLDIDYFKRYNDLYSHATGDLLLRAMGQFLLGLVRKGDVVCRYGGEEFLIILPGIGFEEAYQRAEDIRIGVKNLHVLTARKELDSVSVSIGLAHYPTHLSAPDQLIQAADQALLHAKRNGRDRVEAIQERSDRG